MSHTSLLPIRIALPLLTPTETSPSPLPAAQALPIILGLAMLGWAAVWQLVELAARMLGAA